MIILILSLGIPLGLTILLLIQIIKDPNKADQYKALVLSPFYRFGKWGAKAYIGSKVSYQVTEYFNRHVIQNIADHVETKIDVHWVVSAQDPILKEDATLIVCLKKEDDQTRNILNAAEVALATITYPNVRPNLREEVKQSIDLVTLKKLADRLGKHGSYAFRKYFLEPKIKIDHRIATLYQKLVEIDNRGYFAPILLNELEYIGEGIYARGDSEDRSDEIVEFIEYLINISRIEVGDDVKQWHYSSDTVSAGIILLANNMRMTLHGVKPYIDRINKNLKLGYESIYIISEQNSWQFLKRYVEILDSNDRILIKGQYHIHGIVKNEAGHKSEVKIVLLRKIDVVADNLFKEKIEASSIAIGKTFEGTIIDISKEVAIVSVCGIDAYIKRSNCSWNKIDSCGDVIKVGDKRIFIVKDIKERQAYIELTLLDDIDDPWKKHPLPSIDALIDVTVISSNSLEYICHDEFGRDIFLPKGEISWQDISDEEKNKLSGTLKVKVNDIKANARRIAVSLRQTNPNPWEEINRSIPVGSTFTGTVTEVSEHFVRVEIKNGIVGIIPKERLIQAGGVFRNYQRNIVKGQGINVAVTRVFIARKKIHLDITNQFSVASH